MKCHYCKQMISSSLDDFTPLPQLVQDHLKSCANCSQFYVAMSALGDQLKKQCPVWDSQDGLDRIIDSLDAPRSAFLRKAIAALALALICALLFFLHPKQMKPPETPEKNLLITLVAAPLKGEVEHIKADAKLIAAIPTKVTKVMVKLWSESLFH